MKSYGLLFLFTFLFIIDTTSTPLPERTTVSVLDTEDVYQLRATFSADKIEALKKSIDSSIKPEKLFANTINRYDASITLNDGTTFYMKISDTRIVIKFNKRKNHSTSYERMKTIFTAVKNTLNENKE